VKKIYKLAAAAALAAPLALGSVAAADEISTETVPLTYSQHQALQSTAATAGSPDLTVAQAPVMAQAATSTAATGAAATGAVLSAGPVTFMAPWVLLGLLSLIPLWILMRTVPPKPLRESFPAINLLFNLKAEDQEPAVMPLWQRLLRLAAAASIIVGMAQPHINPEEPLSGSGPVMLVIDNGWASAPNWQDRLEQIEKIIERADREGRMVMLLSTAADEDGGKLRLQGPLSASDARAATATLSAQPWPVDREAALAALDASEEDLRQASATWLSNGLDDPGARALVERLQTLGGLSVLEDSAEKAAHLLVPPEVANSEHLSITVKRPEGSGARQLTLIASDDAGNPVAQTEAVFEAGATEARGVFTLPPELRNELSRVSIQGENSAGAVLLLDERWRMRPVGLVSAAGAVTPQPLLNESTYIEKALDPYVDLHQGSIDDLLDQNLAVLVITDAAVLNSAQQARLENWVREGGTLLRFAGPALAAQSGQEQDSLLPVRLRPGVRMPDGVLSGGQQTGQGRLAPFEAHSPFHGIQLRGDVRVNRDVLADPDYHLDERTWARLQDGTPLVTAAPRGEGWTVLVHTTAGPEWSNLSLSGLYVDMMRAVVAHSQGVRGANAGPDVSLPPVQVLDGNGQLTVPGPGVRPLTGEAIGAGSVTSQNPPGLYGHEGVRHAHNLAVAVPELIPLPPLSEDVSRSTYTTAAKEHNLTGPLLAEAMALLLADLLILMQQQGHLARNRRRPEPVPQKQALKPAKP